MVFANAGIPVLLKETDQAALDRGLATIRKNYANSVKKGRFSQEEMDKRLARISPTLTYDGFGEVDMVMEAVFEGMALKKQIFGELDKVHQAGRDSRYQHLHAQHRRDRFRHLAAGMGDRHALFQSGECDAAARNRARQGQFQGSDRHAAWRCRRSWAKSACWWATAADSSAIACSVLTGARRSSWWKRARRWKRWTRRCTISAWPWDRWPPATWRVWMSAGASEKNTEKSRDTSVRQPMLEDRLCEMGRYGQKTGAGWYKYDENRRPMHDPEVDEADRAVRAETGRQRRAQISAEEIVERTIYALVNEGARILEEGYALRAVDIDIIYINGYGFPAYRGGPMWYADTVGLKNVYDRILRFRKTARSAVDARAVAEASGRRRQEFADFDQKRRGSAPA